jgi:diguanylate cyclase (GGDEF)-like protein
VGWPLLARRIWLVVLLAGVAGALLVPSVRLWLIPSVAVLSAALAIRGILAWRPPAPRAWWTVVAGVSLLAVGYVLSSVDAGRSPDLQPEYPQPYDVLLLVASLIVLVGAVLLLRRMHPMYPRGDLIDALIVAVGLGSIVVQLMFGVELAQEVPLTLPPLAAVTFPLASVVLLTAVARVLLTGGVANKAMVLLTLTVIAAVATDIPRAQQAASGYLPADSVWAAVSVVKMALFACALMTPDVADPRLYAPARPTMTSRTRLLIVVGFGYTGPVILTLGWLWGWPIDPRVPMLGTAGVTALLILRVDRILVSIEHRATHDSLTGLLDHAAFHQYAVAVAAGAKDATLSGRRSTPGDVWIIGILDIDDFKLLNDTYGHAVGDEVLTISASRLVATMRSTDVVGRLGGDEFGILYRDGKADVVARRVTQSLQQPVVVADLAVELGVSLGLSQLSVDPSQPEAAVAYAMSKADAAMYSAKRTSMAYVIDGS